MGNTAATELDRTRGRRQGILAAIAPGILMAGAAIGVSHLVQSTRAGVDYGFQLIWLILLATVVKYPFFEFGHAIAAQESLLEGYLRLGRLYLYTFLFVSFASSLAGRSTVLYTSSPNLKKHARGEIMRLYTLFAFLSMLLLVSAGCQGSEPLDTEVSEAAPAFEEILKIDIHSHIFDDIPALVEMMRRNRVQIVNICNRGTEDFVDLQHQIANDLNQRYPDVLPWANTFDLKRVHEPTFQEEVIKTLDATFEQGALMTKIWKEIGLEVRRPDGSFMLPDDPIFDPVYSHLAQIGKPLLAHLAEPLDAWLPLDPELVHYGYYSNNPQWHLYGRPEFPHHSDIIAARDRIVERHPNLVVIGAHLGSLEHDVDLIAERLDRYPNFYVEVSARTRDLSRQPTEKVRDFFLQYQDRILYGVDVVWRPFHMDSPPSDQRRNDFARNLENRYRMDYQFYAGSGEMEYGGRTVQSLALPRSVLEKFYYRNAHRIIPGLAAAAPTR